MAVKEFRLAQFGMGMQDGTVLRWLKQEGDAITEGEPVLEVETAKSTVEVEAPYTGVIQRIYIGENENVPVQTLLAIIET